MKIYIKKYFKLILVAAIVLFGIGVWFLIRKVQADILPVASEELTLIYCEIDKPVCDYTGESIENEIHRIVFEDTEGNRIVVYQEDFQIVSYQNNSEIGQADIEVSVNGYKNTILMKKVYRIQPARTEKPQVVNATREQIEISWNEVSGADGYLLYKSKDQGQSFMPVKEVKKGETLSYQDTSVALNETYLYYVRTYMNQDIELLFSEPSEATKVYTPLDNPIITGVYNAAYNSLRLEWAHVNGSAGYQVYRCEQQEGEYTLLTEIADGMVTSYTDGICECGKPYYYYIKVCQKADDETIYGEASPVVSGKTTPEKVSLRGMTMNQETSVTLTWKKVNGAQGYEVFKDGNLVAKLENADTLTWSESNLSKDTEASYKVHAYCIFNNEIIYGSFSGTFEKEVVVETNYSAIVSGDLSGVTQYQGVPYVGGGTSPKGWDCSGFTQWVMKNYFGVHIPKSAAQQGAGGKTVSVSDRSSWQPGDILCYTKGKGSTTVTHVALYLGNGKMMHALSTKYDTLIQDVDFYETWDSKTRLYTVKRYF